MSDQERDQHDRDQHDRDQHDRDQHGRDQHGRDQDEADLEDGNEPELDATEAGRREGDAKTELFEAIDHFKNAASILFTRAAHDPAFQTATKEAGRFARKIGEAAEPATKEAERLARRIGDVAEPATKEAERLARKIGDAAEPLAKQLTSELSRLTRDVMRAAEGKPARPAPRKRPRDEDEDE